MGDQADADDRRARQRRLALTRSSHFDNDLCNAIERLDIVGKIALRDQRAQERAGIVIGYGSLFC